MNLKEKEWDESYKKGDNYVFYPHEEIIRFVSKYIRKKQGIDEFINIKDMNRCLDLGCGIGRHMFFLDDFNFDVYGIDLSKEAIDFAQKWFKKYKKNHLYDRLTIGTITNMPYQNNFFDFVISHGVLDSMPFSIAKEGVKETYRVIKPGGLFYFDVISGCDYNHYREYDGEELVETQHEKGTIQSYFNWNKIIALLGDKFKIIEAILIQRESVISRNKNSRWHIIVEKL